MVPISALYSLTDRRHFFAKPATPRQRQYEALRAFYLDGLPSAEVARRFGYSPGAFRVLCHAFRRGELPELFATAHPGRREQPKKSRAHEQIVALRKRNYSVYEISQGLKEQGTPLSATAVREVLAEEGFAPLPRRLDEERPVRIGPNAQAVANVGDFVLNSREFTTTVGGLFLFVPDLVRLDGDALAQGAKLPGSRMIPAAHALRASLAFHCVPYFGEHPLVESHYLSKRSRRQPSILTFLAQDADSQVFCYSNADIRKGEEADEIFRFIGFWKRQYGKVPQHLVFDSKLTTYQGLDRLDAAGITFLTLRRRSPSLLAEVVNLPLSAWRTITLDVPHRKYRTPRVFEHRARPRERSYRQSYRRAILVGRLQGRLRHGAPRPRIRPLSPHGPPHARLR